MIKADKLYSLVKSLSAQRNDGNLIPESGYMNVNDLDVIKNDLRMFSRNFKIQYNVDPQIYGSL